MKLLIDIGNTRLKWAFAGDGALRAGGAVLHGGAPAALVGTLPLEPVESIWLAHVTGAGHESELVEAVRTHYGTAPQIARTTAQWRGLRNAYREPQRLGIDRWLAMIAAWQEAGGGVPLCVVDAGTALTVDIVAQDGEHRGGIIAAGLDAQQRAVLGATRFATREAPIEDPSLLGRDTESCVQRGALLACLGAIDRAAREAGDGARYFITGGDAPELLAQLTGSSWEYRPDLVLCGLAAISQQS